MQIPFTLSDISLWLAVTSITLFITMELASPYYGQTNLVIDIRRLRNATLILGGLFLIAVAIRVIEIISS